MLPKSKLNSTENLISQALTDLDISHEEFKTIVNEKEKYEQMKESVRNTKSKDEKDELIKIFKKIMKIHRLKTNIFLFHIYKMANIIKKTWRKDGVEVIVFNSKKWLNEKHVEEQLKHSNLVAITNRYDLELTKLWQTSTL